MQEETRARFGVAEDRAFVTPPAKRRVRFSSVLGTVGIGAIALSIYGCAGANVTNVASQNTGFAPPTEILVQVDATQASQARDAAVLAQVAASLQSDLVQRLTRAKVTAEPFVAGTSHPGAAVLHVSVTEADPGDLAERLVIGFGAGSATLRARVDLESADAAAQPLVAFDTSSSSPIRPGFILPVGIAAATAHAASLAIGGAIDVAMNVNSGLKQPVQRTANEVVSRLQDYYAAVGWTWPANV